ncbi:MAG: enoyl-CoA hydratase/isomerase family protein [Arenicella sp.]|nr:enoyl-CoA hydratase/isomerase family protein [Arenicella sp.]
MTINKVAVIGAGTMGSGIAGQVANAGIEVWLLDLPTDDNPNALAERGVERLRDSNSPGLMSKEFEKYIHVGNTRDDFQQLADCDWIAEAVVERLDIKQELYKKLHQVCHDRALISSNTSSIPIKLLVEDMPGSFRQRFAITHFFNPVRFMPLLELVRGEETSAAVINELGEFCDKKLGKGVIDCRDTPGFLGNRVGCFAIQCALQAANEMGLSPLEADAIFGRPMGIPKTGVFGLYDLIGIDLMSDVAQSLVNTLPASDAFNIEAEKLPLMVQMIANGQTGNKQGQGFYRTVNDRREVIDLASGDYAVAERLNIPLADLAEKEGVKRLLEDDGKYGQFAWRVLSRTLSYAASLIPEVGDGPLGVDDAMKLGYNWIKGPFALLDEIGVDYFIQRLSAEGREIPPFLGQAAGSTFYRVKGDELQVRKFAGGWESIKRPEGVMRFNEKRRTLTAKNSCAVASWFDLEGVAMVEFHSKANALDADSMAILADAIDHIEADDMRGLVIHNDAQHFSCGVNLQSVRAFFEREDMDGLDQFLAHFQQTVHRMSVADYPVVCAPVGMSLGGGFEVVLHAKQVICHANSTMGLVESGVGLVPGGGGCKETLYRWVEKLGSLDDEDISEAAWKAFMNLGYGRTCSSPILAEQQAMLRSNDHFLSNRDRLLPAALQAVDLAVGVDSQQRRFDRPALSMPGQPVFEAMCAWLQQAQADGKLTPHNVVVATELARIVTGGEIDPQTRFSEQDLYDAERRAFLKLVATSATRERITSMLDTGTTVQN